MSWFPTGVDSQGQSYTGISNGLGGGSGFSSQLWNILTQQDIIPGASPGYQTCKTIYSYHPLGRKMVELPLDKAFSQPRELSFADPNITIAEELIRRFEKTWAKLGGLGGNTIIYRIAVLSRIYGIASLLCGTRGADPETPLDFDTLYKQDLYFSMLDPLNTAGSLVLSQDPISPNFLQPQQVWAAGKNLDPSRTAVLIHEQPIWIEWTDSAFGFVGRSVYQRSLYPLKSYLLSMVADNEIQRKLMLLIAKIKSPASILDKATLGFFNVRRSELKDSATGNVISIGIDEAIESLNLEHTDKGGTYSRNNIIRNIASASGMPAMLLLDERIAEGFGEGKEDAKEISIYIDGLRRDLTGMFEYLQKVAMYVAWNPEWYKTSIQSVYSEYRNLSYEAAMYQWRDAFDAKWPSLYQPTEAEQLESEAKKVAEAVKLYQAVDPSLDPVNRAAMLEWLQSVVQETKLFSKADIDLDPDALIQWSVERQQQEDEQARMAAESGVPGPGAGKPGQDKNRKDAVVKWPRRSAS